MSRLVSDEGVLLKDGDRTCRGICDRHTSCESCPISEALKKLAAYERKEQEDAEGI